MLVVQLDRDEKRNAINGEMTESISAALDAGEDDPAVRAIVIAGGPTVFCAGTDIAEGSGTPTDRGGEYGIIRRRRPRRSSPQSKARLRRWFEIALACHLIVASTTATFGLPEVRRGLVATSAGLFRVPRALPLNVAREMLLTGDPVSAQRLADLGVVNRVVEPGMAVAEAIALAERIELNAPTSIRATLTALDDSPRTTMRPAGPPRKQR